MEYSWLCMVSKNTGHKKEWEAGIKKDLRKIFGRDVREVIVISDSINDMFDNESYIFVECRNYLSHVSELKKSSFFCNVIPSFDNPSLIDKEEVETFRSSVENAGRLAKLYVGDVVRVKVGDLENLTGIVAADKGDGVYSVLFRFHTKEFTKILSIEKLEYLKSLFDNLRVPVVCYSDDN